MNEAPRNKQTGSFSTHHSRGLIIRCPLTSSNRINLGLEALLYTPWCVRNLEDRWGGWERLWERVEARSSDENEGHLTGRRGTLRGHARLLRWTGRGVCRDEEGQRLLEGQGVNSESRVGCPGWGRAPSVLGVAGDRASCRVNAEVFIYRVCLGTLECVDI